VSKMMTRFGSMAQLLFWTLSLLLRCEFAA
jgi:hypothetical protein